LRFPAPEADAKVQVGFVFKRTTKPPPVPRWRKIGVPECDQYIRGYLTCLYKNVPTSRRVDTVKELRKVHKVWRKMASEPERRSKLPQACKVATRTAERVFNVFGCLPVK
jgi:hypothetical protein